MVYGSDRAVEPEVTVGDGEVVYGVLGNAFDEAAEVIAEVPHRAGDQGWGLGWPLDADVGEQVAQHGEGVSLAHFDSGGSADLNAAALAAENQEWLAGQE